MSNRRKKHYDGLDVSGALPETHEGHFAKAIVAAIFGALMVLLLWAAVTPVDEITTGNGVIITRALSERVEHPDGGVVAHVSAVAGQEVEVGTELLIFDTESLAREMQKLGATRMTLQAELRRIDFVLEGKGQIPSFSNLSELSAQELLFWAEQSFLDAQLNLIDADSRAIGPALDLLKARVASMEREIEILKGRLKRNRLGQINGVIALNTVEVVEREFLQLQRSVLELRAEMSAQLSALEANALRAKEIFAKRNREAALRRSEIKEQIVAVSVMMAEVTARIERATVRASRAGTIMEIAVSNPREFVAPGELIAEIIPVNDSLEAEIEVSADRIGSVEVGMEARLKVLSYDFTRYGEIIGLVASISPTSYLDDQGNTVFRVLVALAEGDQTPRLGDKPIVPGMTVTADILTDSKKVLSFLLKPLRALGDRAFTEA